MFKEISNKIAMRLRDLRNVDEYYRVVGRGVSGDLSRLIDVISEEYVVDLARKEGIKAWIVGEEKGIWRLTETPDYIILLDPLDGSLNYVHGLEYASVSMSVYLPGSSILEPIYGIVKSVFTDQCFEICNGTVMYNGKRVDTYRRNSYGVVSIYTEDPRDLEVLREAYRDSGYELKTRTMGSASMESALAALGYLGGFIHLTGKLRNLDIAVSLAISHRLGVKTMIKPDIREIKTMDIELIKKIVIAPSDSPIWRIADKLGHGYDSS